jgi:LacI family transcriptional regulator, gluconate utilization system Gnt-I transcriptional repressor
MVPTLTSMRTPRAEIGRSAAQMLVALMRGEPVASPILHVDYALQVREST